MSPQTSFGQTNPTRDPRFMLAGNAAAILHSAARRVALNWGPHAARSTDVAELSLVLAGTIAETQITGTAVIDDRVRSDVGRRLIARLRKEIITQWSGSGTPDSELPPLLLALERVHDALEPTPVEAFTEQVGGPDGMELLVD